jgi:hypothetical protein
MSTNPPDPFLTSDEPAAPPGTPTYAAPPPTPQPQAAPPQPPYGAAPVSKPKTWMNVVSLVAVGVGIFMPIVANIIGIVFGHMGIRAADRGEADYRGVGLAGLILNYVIAILAIVAFVAYVAFVVWVFNDCANDPNSTFCD